MKILNLTQHKTTKEQRERGIFDLPDKYKEEFNRLLTFNELPTEEIIHNRIYTIQCLLYGYYGLYFSNIDHTDEIFKEKTGIDGFMIGGAMWIIAPLGETLRNMGDVYFAFSKRVSIEEEQDDGSVIKKSIFRFEGLVPYTI